MTSRGSTTKFTATLLLFASRYPQGATKADKATIRKRSKKFEVLDCILHYKEKKGNSVKEEQLINIEGFLTNSLGAST